MIEKQTARSKGYKRILLLALLCISSNLFAQNGFVELGLRGGSNATFDSFTAMSLVVQHHFTPRIAVVGGIQDSSYGRFSAEVRPSYTIDIPLGQLHFEAMFHYFSQNNTDNTAIGGGVGIASRRYWATIGYYHRTLSSGDDELAEPFNLYYSFGVSLLPSLSDWDVKMSLTNSRYFDLERHYVPSLAIDGWWYPCHKAGVTLGICYKPTGVFHISSDYYQLYAHFGVCYKW